MEKEEMVKTGDLTEEQAPKTEGLEAPEASQTKAAEKKEKQAEKQKTAPELQKKTEKSKSGKSIPPFLESYVKAYPNETVFHVTTDKQVFLEKDLNMARFHQRSLKIGGEVQTIKMK